MPQIPEFWIALLVVYEAKSYAYRDEGRFQSPELQENHQEPLP